MIKVSHGVSNVLIQRHWILFPSGEVSYVCCWDCALIIMHHFTGSKAYVLILLSLRSVLLHQWVNTHRTSLLIAIFKNLTVQRSFRPRAKLSRKTNHHLPECGWQNWWTKAEQVDDKSRFNDDKLLWLDMDIPSSLLEKAGPPENIDGAVTLKQAEGHFYLLRHQFLQVQLFQFMSTFLLSIRYKHCEVNSLIYEMKAFSKDMSSYSKIVPGEGLWPLANDNFRAMHFHLICHDFYVWKDESPLKDLCVQHDAAHSAISDFFSRLQPKPGAEL